MYILWFVAAACIGIGAYNILCTATEIPSGKTTKMMMLTAKHRGEKKEKLLDVYVTRLASKLERFVRIDKLQRSKIQIALDATEQQISPEIYLLKAFIKAVLVVLCGFPFFFILPLFFLIFVALGVLMFLVTYYSALDYSKKRRKKIESELPRFAVAIAQGLQNSRDVLGLLLSYRKAAGKELGQELDTTIAEMRTGNYEQALIHMEARVGSPLLSDITRGLIGTIRGDDQTIYFRMISFDMRQLEQQNLKKEVAKKPKQIQKYSMMMLLCILIIYGVVLGTEIAGSLGVFFR